MSYDKTLLAVVGVLDTVRAQRNVAAWIHAGGLWGPIGPPKHAGSTVSSVASSSDEQTAALEKQADGVDDAQPGGGKKRRKKPRHKAVRREAEAEAARLAAASETGSQVHALSPAGNDEVTTAATPPGLKMTSDLSAVEDAPEVSSATIWFEDPRVVDHWATLGREVLEEMGIPVEHGMER